MLSLNIFHFPELAESTEFLLSSLWKTSMDQEQFDEFWSIEFIRH